MNPGDPVQTTLPPILTGNVVQISDMSVFFYCQEYQAVIAMPQALLEKKTQYKRSDLTTWTSPEVIRKVEGK